jgi:hypothetical protein
VGFLSKCVRLTAVEGISSAPGPYDHPKNKQRGPEPALLKGDRCRSEKGKNYFFFFFFVVFFFFVAVFFLATFFFAFFFAIGVSQKRCDLKRSRHGSRHLMPESYGTRDSGNYTQESTKDKINPRYLCGSVLGAVRGKNEFPIIRTQNF